MKKTIRIISTILAIIIFTVSACYLVFATEESLSVDNIETNVVSGLKNSEVLYSMPKPTGKTNEIINALNERLKVKSMTGSVAESYISGSKSIVLNKYGNVFCAKQGKGLSKAGGPVISGPHGKFTKNMNDYITFDETTSVPTLKNNPTIFKDRCEAGSPGSGGNTASNFNVKKHWSGDLKSIDNFYGIDATDNPSNVIPYAITFNDKKDGGIYTKSTTQKAIWGVTGNTRSGKDEELYKAGKAVDDYDVQVELHGQNPTITVGDHAGAVVTDERGTTIRIGPFKMSDYAFAYSENVIKYSGKNVKQYKGLIGGIDGMQITVKDDAGNSDYLDIDNNKVKIVYEDWYGNPTSKGERNRSTGSYTTAIKAEENIYPAPNSTFYIDIQRNEIKEYTTLLTISLSYRKTETSGTGDVIITRYAKTNFTVTDTGKRSDCKYSCVDDNSGSGMCGFTKDPGEKAEPYTGTCKHSWYINCKDNQTCSTADCETKTDENGEEVDYCPGNHHFHDALTPPHSHTTTYKCPNGYKDCHISEWKANTPTVGYGQPVLIANSAECKVISTVKEFKISLRITTDIEIKKYIKEVKHDTNGKITFGEDSVGGKLGATQKPEERAKKQDTEKEADPVYAEYGDIITYQIDVINHQNYEVKIKLKDTLPDKINVISRGFSDNTWLIIPGNKTTTYLIVVRTNANDDNVYVNEVKLITKNWELTKNNTDNVDFIRTTDSYGGPVVNIAEIESSDKIKSKEYFKINDYNISIDKYISKYNAEMMNSNNSNSFTNETYKLEDRSNKDIEYKSTRPFPVEQTETFVYTIKLTNNSKKENPGKENSEKGNKVATQVRPTAVIDKLDTGLEFISVTAKIVKPDGSTRLELNNSSYSAIRKENNKQELTLTLADKQGDEYVILNPDESLVYEMLVKVTESNLYLNSLKNTANIAVLTNINNGKNNNKEKNICKTCSGKGKTSREENCINCGADGKITETEICPECLGNGTCTECNGEGKLTKTCTHENIVYVCKDCGTRDTNKPTTCDSTFQVECGGKNIKDNKCQICNAEVPKGTKRCTNLVDTKCVSTTFERDCMLCLANLDELKPDDTSEIKIVCTECNGTKTLHKEELISCIHCNNTGKVSLNQTCDMCLGKGKVEIEEDCSSCNGSGTTNNTTSADRIVRTADGKLNRNTNAREKDSEYVKMKDLVISGKVWLDRNKDGTIGFNSDNKLETGKDSIDVESNPSTYIPDTTGKEYAMKGIAVKLYTSDGTLVRITETDENGLFTFARKEDLNNNADDYYAGLYSRNATEVVESEQRIEKATNKDANKNYTSSSKMISYYVEYEYDGLVYKSTEIYAGSTNLNEDDSLKAGEAYKYDSNAYEFDTVRKEFNKKYEIIGFDKGYNADLSYTEKLEYDKQNHNSYIKENDARKMTARSFIDIKKQSTNYLWLHQQTSYDKPETEYLKYINLGLEEREDVDISITHDVYEVKTTVNGEEMTYEYNQNDYTLGNEKIDKAQYADAKFNSELYMTGYETDASVLTPYEFWLYNSDYNYKVSQYNIDTVKEYKGKESELNVETTFRIKVTNNSFTNDEPFLEDGKKDIKVYTGINEIAEYYDNQFVDLEFNEDGTVKTFNIKTKDENGYLVNTPLKVVKAEYVKRDGTRQEAILSHTSMYNPENSGIRTLKDSEGQNLYSTLYIRPKVDEGKLPLANDIILEEGESVDILITFVIDKEEIDNELYVHVGEMINIAEVSAYSTYYKKEDGTYYSAGLVDKDSNPGNFGELYGLSANKNVDSQEYLALYEDDTFKTGITTLVQGADKDRAITGFVWDDARTEIAKDEEGTQYIGDGIFDDTINAEEKQPEAKRNDDVSNKEVTDIVIQDMKTQLIEMVLVPIRDANGNVLEERVYEETILACGDLSQMTTKTDAEGKYMLKGYIPGDYIVKFFYGNDVNSESMVIFNGQDYKSTTYQAEQEGKPKEYAEYQANSDLLLAKLEEENISDAKDDEIRRLEVISYSETMNNNLNNILRGKNSSDKAVLIANTNMESETTKFLVRTEKEVFAKTSLTYEEAISRFNTITRHPIRNIDFGIEYRPELQVSLNKYITNITITTSDANGESSAVPLVDAKFTEYYGIVVETDEDTGKTTFLADENGEVIRLQKNEINKYVEDATIDEIKEINKSVEDVAREAGVTIPENIKDSSGRYIITIAGTELDTDNSIGLSNLQYVENIDDIQGFAYLNIDDEIMQGSTISIKYLFVGNNLSEVDRVSSNLSELRFKENDAALAYRGDSDKFYDEVSFQLGENTGFIDLVYSGARTARNRLFNEYYGYELNEENQIKTDKLGSQIRYRKKAKKIEVDENKKVIKAIINNPNNDSTYYGRYLGSLYYTGVIGDKDIVAEVKIDKILDYIDNDLVFETKNNNTLNNLWKATTSGELLSSYLVSGNSFITLENGNTTDPGLVGLSGKYLLDSKNRAYDTNEKSNLALLQDDRIKDYTNPADDITVNKDISRFLLPRISHSQESYGGVSLVATKVISAEELTEDMNYENIGEIVQYSSITGRVTPFATTLGNVSFFEQDADGNLKKDFDGDYIPVKEWDEAQTESDTAATELITLTPPTGLGKIERVVRNTVEGASYIIIAIIIVAVIDLGVFAGVTLYRKRRIK